MLLSVIVPVYNVERYLPRCLESLLRQGLEAEEYEVICVNDGSSDNSALVLTDYAQLYPRIVKVIHQRNQGLGPARNTGMAAAQGEYIAFVDSDDYVVDGAYGYLLSRFCQDKPDVVGFGHRMVRTQVLGDFMDYERMDEGEVLFESDGNEAYAKMRLMTVWSKLYRRSFLAEHNIRFKPVVSEDEVFNVEVFWWNPSLVRMTSCNAYRFEQGNPNAIMKTRDRQRVLVQLKDHLYNLGVMNQYMMAEDQNLLHGVRRTLNTVLHNFYKKALSISLTRQEWNRYTMRRKSLLINQIDTKDEVSTLRKLVARLYNASGHSYESYLLVRFLCQLLPPQLFLPLSVGG